MLKSDHSKQLRMKCEIYVRLFRNRYTSVVFDSKEKPLKEQPETALACHILFMHAFSVLLCILGVLTLVFVEPT